MICSSVIAKILGEMFQKTEEQIILFCRMETRQSYGLNDEDYIKLQTEAYPEFGDSSSGIDGVSDDTALQVISHTRTYFDMSSKRVVEVIPMICELFLTEKLEQRLVGDFQTALGIFDKEKCSNLVQEDPEVQKRRQGLLRKKGIVKNALEIIGRSIYWTIDGLQICMY